MDNSFVFNETTLRRIPQFLVLVIVLLLGLPYVGLYFGLDFGSIANKLNKVEEYNSWLLESQIRGYFRQTLLQWSGFALAAVTILLAFTQYKLSEDKIALIIGLSVLFSGSMEALHTLLVDGLSLGYKDKSNLDAMVWMCSNSISGIIIIVGLIVLLHDHDKHALKFSTFIYLIDFLVFSALALIYFTSKIIDVPNMWYSGLTLTRPYELISISVYLALILFVYPKAYKAYPTILVDCIFYIAVTQIVISIYLMVLSSTPYDSAYNIAYFLKLLAYFIPCTCLLANYVHSYSEVLRAQKELKEKQKELQYIASHDKLTNLFNRREFEYLLDHSLMNAKKGKDYLALLLIDIDNFKTTNDSFGHVHGDELLKQFSNRLMLLIRKDDILSRVGGDEFTLISPNIKSTAAAQQLAERILNELNNPYPIKGKLITVGVSVGISIYPDDGTTSEELLIKADLAMYKAKRSGKNTYQFYTKQLGHFHHREAEIETHLRQALQNDELELYYQPKFKLRTREITGAEVLLRWHSAALGEITPDEFIPVAESTGLIIDIGLWIIRTACKQIIVWNERYNKRLVFSVNISPIQLANNQFLKTLKNILKEYVFPSQQLELEITESLLMGSDDEVNYVLNSISSLGVQLSLDDFGKGYSSMSRLKMLPIDTLKIDKDFISDIHHEYDKVIIVDIIIRLATELGMTIVAEGVETIQQLNYLIARNCHIGQGFFLSPAVKKDEFAALAYSNLIEKAQ